MATTQPRLQLVVDARQPDWKLDDSTKQVGREGVAAARAAMRRRPPSGSPDRGPTHPHAA